MDIDPRATIGSKAVVDMRRLLLTGKMRSKPDRLSSLFVSAVERNVGKAFVCAFEVFFYGHELTRKSKPDTAQRIVDFASNDHSIFVNVFTDGFAVPRNRKSSSYKLEAKSNFIERGASVISTE